MLRWPSARGCRMLLGSIETGVAFVFVWAQLAAARPALEPREGDPLLDELRVEIVRLEEARAAEHHRTAKGG